MPTFKPQTPTIVDPTGVPLGNEPRPMGTSTDMSRAEVVDETGGEPLVDFDSTSNPYIDYQSIDLLLTLQHPRSDAYDETCFFIMGQVKELLFKSLHFELHNARHLIRDDQVHDALMVLDRSLEITKLLINTWDVVATVSSTRPPANCRSCSATSSSSSATRTEAWPAHTATSPTCGPT